MFCLLRECHAFFGNALGEEKKTMASSEFFNVSRIRILMCITFSYVKSNSVLAFQIFQTFLSQFVVEMAKLEDVEIKRKSSIQVSSLCTFHQTNERAEIQIFSFLF